jgi:hypothetical protein
LEAFTKSLQTPNIAEFAYIKSIEIVEGVCLTRSSASPVWRTYFRWSGHTFRKSTRKRDFDQAKMVALEIFHDIIGNWGSTGAQRIVGVKLRSLGG